MNENMDKIVSISLSFDGGTSDQHQIDLYDVSQALIGFQRSIALTTHLVLNGEIITQAPSLKGAQILASPAEEGSWQIVAAVFAGIYAIGTAPKDTPLGHMVHSLYDYVVSESLGEHVDYDKSLGELIEEHNHKKDKAMSLEQHKVDSLIEKCSTAITEIHRPIFKTNTAKNAKITSNLNGIEMPVGPVFSLQTYQYIHEEFVADFPEVIKGRISSYNSNTYKGRIYVAAEGRPVAFELSEDCRSDFSVTLITSSLAANAIKEYDNEWNTIYCRVFRNTSRAGHLKSYKIVELSHEAIE